MGQAEATAAHIAALQSGFLIPVLEVLSVAHIDAARAEHAMGRTSRAMELLEIARQHADDEDLLQLGRLAASAQVELAARAGDLSLAEAGADAIGLPLLWQEASTPYALPWVVVEGLACAMFHLALRRQDLPAAAAIALTLEKLSSATGQRLGELLSLAMSARLGGPQPSGRAALDLVQRVIAMSAETGAVRPLIDMGAELVAAVRSWQAGTSLEVHDPVRAQALHLVSTWELEFKARSHTHASNLLTPRETDVLAALAIERSTKLAARRLMLSPETVKHHLKSVFSKLGVRTREEALHEARRRGFLA